MKHPKSKLFIAVACLVLPLLFASCSKDEENANDPMPFVPIEQNDLISQLISCNLILTIQFLSKETMLTISILRLWAPTRVR